MSFYPWIKHIHITTVSITAVIFLLRLYWVFYRPENMQRRWVKIVPHVNDATLLFSGLSMALLIHQYPLVDGWLTAKLTALLAYIILGTIALKRGKNQRQKIIAALLAILAFAYIISVAFSKDAMSLSYLLNLLS